MTLGRPPKFNTPEEMQHRIDLYFLACKVHQTGNADLLRDIPEEDALIINDIDDVFPTVTGLGLALDLTRRGLIDYEEKDAFYHTVKKAKQRVENAIEQRLFYNNATGSIFNLKNNFEWKDQQDVNQRYVNKDGDDIAAEDLKILADYEKRVKGATKSSPE